MKIAGWIMMLLFSANIVRVFMLQVAFVETGGSFRPYPLFISGLLFFVGWNLAGRPGDFWSKDEEPAEP